MGEAHDIGPYRTVRELGRGGMGVVYEALHRGSGERVALKLLLDPAHAEAVDLARFQRETAACSRLSHPNLVRYHGAGMHHNRPYLAMEFIEGEDLGARLKREGPMEPEAAVHLLVRVARGLARAHALGILHRDIKPDNVMLRGDQPVLTDFGLARTGGREIQRLTHTGDVLGTPTYMAPEQADGDPRAMGPATDIYSLGVMLYAMLTGQPPFTGGSFISILTRVLTEPAPPPSRARAGIAPDLDDLCVRCLAKEPSERFASATELAEALEALELAAAATPASGGVPLGAVAGVVAIALSIGLFMGRRQAPAPSPSSSPSPALVPSPSSSPRPPAHPPAPTPNAASVSEVLQRAKRLLRGRRFEAARAEVSSVPESERSPEVWVLLSRIEVRLSGVDRLGGHGTSAYVALSEALRRVGDDAPELRAEILARRSVLRGRPKGDADYQEDLREAIRLGKGRDSPFALYARAVMLRLEEGAAGFEREIDLLERAYEGHRGTVVTGLLIARLGVYAWRDYPKLDTPMLLRGLELLRARIERDGDSDARSSHHLGAYLKDVVGKGFRANLRGYAELVGASEEGIFEQAEAAFSRALELEPTRTTTLLELGFMRFQRGGAIRAPSLQEKGLADLRRASRKGDYYFACWIYARCLRSLGRVGEALGAAQRAIALGPPVSKLSGFYREYESWASGDPSALTTIESHVVRDLEAAEPGSPLHIQLRGLRRKIASLR
jgi:serine/threonine protein kinase